MITTTDNTDENAPIYLEVFNEFPDKIKHIFIRASSKKTKNEEIKNPQNQNPNAPLDLIFHSEVILDICKSKKETI